MSEPLSNIDFLTSSVMLGPCHETEFGITQEQRLSINKRIFSELDQLSPDANKLARIICEKVHKWGEWKTADEDKKRLCLSDAQEIINKMNLWVVKKG